METEAPKNKASSPQKEWTPLELAEMKSGKYLGPIHRPKGFSSRLMDEACEGRGLLSCDVSDGQWGVSLWADREGSVSQDDVGDVSVFGD
ncbi:MAG: hypothetical protein ACJAQT_003174 [Akkermansiaceae bacterium]|jgi:hypothetical protein